MKKAESSQGSLWDSLSKEEQEKIKKDLAEKRRNTPAPEVKRKGNIFNLKGYCRCELAAADKEGFRAWEEGQDSAAVFDFLHSAVSDGYLVKMGAVNGGYQASFSAATTDRDWDGYVLVAHAGTAARAALLLMYKHLVMMQRDWSEWLGEDGEDALR